MSELDKRIAEIREREEEHARMRRAARSASRVPQLPFKPKPIDRIEKQEQVPIGSLDFLSLETRVNLFQFAISCAAKDLKYDKVAPLIYDRGRGRSKIFNPPALMRLRHQRLGWMVDRGTSTITVDRYSSGYGEIGMIEQTADATTHLYVQKDDTLNREPTIWVPPHEAKVNLQFDEATINKSLVRIISQQQIELVPLTPDQENGVF